MTQVLSNDGSILLSLPHVGHSAIAASMLQDDFEYREWGLLDKTHIRFFGVKNVQALIENANLAIVESHFIRKKPEETEFEESWKKLSRRAQSILNDRLFGDVYQIVTKSVLSGNATNPIYLPDTSMRLANLIIAICSSL